MLIDKLLGLRHANRRIFMHVQRRTLLLGLAAFALALSVDHDRGALANAPVAKGQAPGWFRMMLGDFEITAISDGTGDLPMDKLLTGSTPAKINAALGKSFLKVPFETSINFFVVNTGTKLVLIDNGAGGLFGPTLGKGIETLKSSGYKPEQIDEIYITHMHVDHVGGLVANGKIAFPNAVVRAHKLEGEFWLTPANMEKAPAAMKDFFQGAMAAVGPYAAAGKYKPFEGETELVPGVRALPALGHTPGHTVYVVESKGEKMVFWGDLIHVAAVQFPDPSVTIQFDADSAKAKAARAKAFADAAKGGYLAAAAHISFPGIGQIRTDGAGYRWYPVNYQRGK
jgi:glyoxylase-like metal-dependent hydrolase (beta-lactamase superfamily II)